RKRAEQAESEARRQLGPNEYAAAWEAGKALSYAQVIGEAMALIAVIEATLASQESPSAAAAAGLTAREQDVLRLLVAGRSNAEIAAKLFISPRTATTHVSNLYAKLGVASRAEAIAFGHRHGLADLDQRGR
ncbi:MAG TPA: response regulator transcription factor, partial [Thermomicrobiales bacterium]|nr:response regulator transcription factor [Thermomicrobiales bacterium]